MSVSRLILLLGALALPTVSAAATATISGVSRIYLRTGPATTYTPNGVVAGGDQVTTLEQVGNWYRVQTADGRTGFVYSGYMTFADSATPPAVAAEPAPPAAGALPAEPAPAAVASPAVALPESGATAEEWQSELASLKAEVARLRSEVGDRAPVSSDPTVSAALSLPTRVPVEITQATAESSNLRTVGVAVFFLVVGWMFGAGFARRRTRSQRGRLRF